MQSRIVRNTSSSQTPTGAQIFNTREGANRKRNEGTGGKGSHQTGFPSTRPILKQLITCKEKGRGQLSCYKSEESERLCGLPAFQDGGHLHSEGPDPTKRLDDKVGSEGRLFLCTNAQRSSEVFSFPVDKLHQGIQLSSVRLQTSTQEVHKVVQTSPSPPMENGNEAGDIHRRNYHPEPKPHSSVAGQRHCDLFATVPGVCNQLDQVPVRTNTVIGILGVPSEFCLDDPSFTRTDGREYSKEVPLSLEQPIIINSSDIRTSRHANSICSSSVASPTPLQEIADGTNRIHNQVSVIQYNCDHPSILQGRGSVVDSQFAEQQQHTNYYASLRSDNNVRCIKDLMGGNLQCCLDRGGG